QHPTCAGYANGSATVMVTGGTPSYTYAWSANTGGQVTPTASGLPSGAYLVTVTDANHCTAQASTTLSAPTMVTLAAQAPDTVCVNAPVQLTAQAGGGHGGYVITWTGIGTGDTLVYSFPASQVVTVTVSDAIGCPGPTFTLPVAVLDLTTATLHTYGDTTVCPGGTAQVGAWLSGYPGGYSMAWPQLGTSGTGPFTVPVTSSNTLDVVVTNTCGQTLSAPVVLQLEAPPTIVLPALLGEGCAPLSVTFPDLGLPGPLQYHWNLGNGQTSTSPMPTVTYGAGQYSITLSVSTPAGCTSSAATPAAVIVHAPPIADFTADPWITDIDHAHIVFTDQSQGDLVDWAWDLGDGSTYTVPDPEHTYTDLGIFPVELWVMDVNGCTDTIVQPVVIKPVHDITVPNIFTPGGPTGGYWIPGDLSNDTFYPFVRFVKDFRMRIFNRWGELVFESFDVAQGWDGWYRSAISAQDVYVYQIWVRFVDNYERTLMGDVTLMR
ncbi:MAG: PKD domain-containing protein, partial [Bacteroidetes bacterium]|nr:PKD domain-containing protein [Bacteroidota bacterium]